jgi:hypothetical protein
MDEPEASKVSKVAEALFRAVPDPARVRLYEDYSPAGCLMGLLELAAELQTDGTPRDRAWTELQLLGRHEEVLARRRIGGHHLPSLLAVVARSFRGPVELQRWRQLPQRLAPSDWLLPHVSGAMPQALDAMRRAGAELEQGPALTARFSLRARHWTPLLTTLVFAGGLVVVGPLGWLLGALLGALLIARAPLPTLLRPLWGPSDERVTLVLDDEVLRVRYERTDVPPLEQQLSREDVLAILPEGQLVVREGASVPEVGSRLRPAVGRARGLAVAALIRARWGAGSAGQR